MRDLSALSPTLGSIVVSLSNIWRRNSVEVRFSFEFAFSSKKFAAELVTYLLRFIIAEKSDAVSMLRPKVPFRSMLWL